MITLEDQIRRYATDVAGPAVGEPPADLLAFTRPRHRGRWVLVAALALFIAGLGSLIALTTPTSPPPTTTDGPTGAVVSRPLASATCTPGAPDPGVVFTGAAAEGLCISVAPFTDPYLGDYVELTASEDGKTLGGFGVRACRVLTLTSLDLFGALDVPGGKLLLGAAPGDAAFVRLANGTLLVPARLPDLAGAGLVVARLEQGASLIGIEALDADQNVIPTGPILPSDGCPAAAGP